MALPALPATPDQSVARELPIGTWFQWSLNNVLVALAQHEQGQFFASAMLCDYLLRDDRVSATLGTRINALLGLPFTIQPGKRADKRSSGKIVRALEEDWERILPRGQAAEAKRWVTMMGFAIGELVYDTSGRWVPEVKIWHPAHCWYDITTRQYVVNTMDGPHWITPGDGKWVVFAPHGQYRGWMHGAVRALAVLVMLRSFGTRDVGRLCEMLGAGLMLVEVPANAEPKDVANLKSQLQRVHSEGKLFLRQFMKGNEQTGFKVSFAGSDVAQGAAKLFDTALSRADMGITLVLLGQNTTTEAKEGGFLAARSHGDVRQDYLEFDASTLREDMTRQVLRPWAVYNFGDEDAVPEAGWDPTPPEDKDAAAKTFQAVAAAIVSLANVSLGQVVDFEALFEKFGIPVIPEEARVAVPVPVPVPAKKGTA